MNKTQEEILELSKVVDINTLGVRELARKLGVHPQSAKYHKEQLIKKNMLKRSGMHKASRNLTGLLYGSDLISIPYLGSANCGPAVRIAGAEPSGEILVSTRLLDTKRYESLFAVKADGDSMNTATVDGRNIESGDFLVIDNSKEPRRGDCVLATIDNNATIKRYHPEKNSDGSLHRITLMPDSTTDHDPIFIHPEDDSEGLIAGVVVQVLKRPALS